MRENKIALIQVWIGQIPDYFWYHYESTKNIQGVDFYFFTDQEIKLDAKNYKVFKIDLDGLEKLISKKINYNIKILSNKKVCDLKASYGDIFYDYIKDYEYFGCYDIDTIFGDFQKFVFPLIGHYDVISIGNDVFHNRIGGPFCIFKNNTELNKLYICEEFKNCFLNTHVDCFEEGVLNSKLQGRYSIKILNEINCETQNGGKNTYDCFWRGGKVFSKGEELFLYHFYRKNRTKFSKIGNLITANYDKKLLEDFYWVVSFTQDYEHMFVNMMDSIKKYSNRKCIVYSINYDFVLPMEYMGSEQFIVRRINLDKGEKDSYGRDNNIITSKPKINIDVLEYIPNGKFVTIDTDIYFTTNSDKIVEYFNDLENYPLINSHVFDTVILKNIVQNQEWASPLHILLEEMGVETTIYPRRKTNVVLFDYHSKWFFEMQMEIYIVYKNKKEGILALHDEDTANAILNKFNLRKSLPLVDTEDLNYLDFEHISNYNFSPHLPKPKTKNHILFFHGVKSQERFDAIKNDFGNSVLDCEEFYITYENGKIAFEKNSFLTTKKNSEIVSFKIFDERDNLIFNLSDRNIINYFYFFVDNLYLPKGMYKIQITEDKDDYCIFRDVIEIK